MLLKLISWNIRHFRQSKIDDFIHTLWEVCSWADVVFIYEDHAGLGKKFAEALNAFEAKQGKTQLHWSGDEIYRTDEYVAVVWRRPFTVARNRGAEAGIADLMSGERAPAVVDVTSGTSTATIAAWHAYGPAKVAAKDLFQKMLRMNHCDVLIGDFNFQSFDKSHRPGGLQVDASEFDLDESMDFEVGPAYPVVADTVVGRRSIRLEATQVMQEVVPGNHQGSTTYTEEAFGKRTTGLDRCLVKKQHVASVQLHVAKPTWHDEMWALTDHVPLLLIFEVGSG